MLQIQPLFRQKESYEALAAREGLGFEVLELCFSQKKEVRDWYERCGAVTSLHGAFIDVNPGSGDKDFRLLSQKKCEESCALALALGAKQVVFHSSCFPNLRGGYLEGWLAYCSMFYQELAERYPLTVCIENSFDLDPEPIRLLINETAHPRVKACLDLGHALCSRTPLEDWIDGLAGRIGYLHLSDNRGSFDDHLPLGDGKLPWEPVRALLQQLPPDTPMTLEVGNLAGIEASLAFLKKERLLP